MYNDSWPVAHGWTIVDYYLRKKLAYYAVKRAFNPIAIVITNEEGKINFYGVNDSPADWAGQIRYGLFGIKGGLPLDEKDDVNLPANQSTLIKSIKKEEWTKLGMDKHGAFAEFNSPAFVGGASIDVDGEADLPDNCFDLIPGFLIELPGQRIKNCQQ